MTSHPSRLTLERLSVDDLPDDLRHSIAEHVDSCSACQAYVEELRAFGRERLAAVPPARFLMRLEARRPRRVIHWWQRAGLGLLTATAAAAAAWLLIPRAAVSPTGDVRFKGAGVVVQRKRVAQTRVLADSDRVRAGDLLRVVVTLQRAEPVAVWFVDARGRVDRFLREEAVLLGAGEHPLPGSAVVEAPCQDLWLVVATGTAANARTEKAMRRAVARGVPAGDGWRPRGTLVRSMRCE